MKRAPLVAAATLMLGACSLAPTYVRPEPPVPGDWPTGDAYLAESEAALPPLVLAELFRDPRLQSLIEQALTNNRDLRVAYANVAAARAQVRVTRSAQFPAIGVSGSADYVDGGLSGGIAGGGRESYALQAGVSGFEIDLFGRLANATAAQRERALASEAAERTVRLSLIADLAEAWANHAADRELLAIAQETADNARRSVTLTRARLEGGVAPRTDLRQAEQVLATAEGDLALQTAAVAQDENLIRLLVGGAYDPALLPSSLTDVAASIAAPPAGTRSEVLLRRPDVAQAEYLLRAANADIGVARARLFPSISLTGLFGFASDALSSLFDGDAFRWSAGGDVGLSIFDAGGRRAGVAVSEAQRDAALAAYEGAIQSAFREVSDALADRGTLAERQRAARANREAAADTAGLVEARYRGGIDSFLSSLDAQRSLYAARRGEIAVELAAIRNRITLYRALGGDGGAGD